MNFAKIGETERERGKAKFQNQTETSCRRPGLVTTNTTVLQIERGLCPKTLIGQQQQQLPTVVQEKHREKEEPKAALSTDEQQPTDFNLH